jgi:hypothetical protein
MEKKRVKVGFQVNAFLKVIPTSAFPFPTIELGSKFF